MKITRFTKFFLSSLIMLLTFSTGAQTETLYTLNSYAGYSDLAQKIGNKLIFTSKNTDEIWEIDLTTGELDTLLFVDNFMQSPLFGSNGLFFISYDYMNGSDKVHSINFIDTLGNQLSPVEINDYSNANPVKYNPKFPTICNERYYINGYYNNLHCVWESDGTSAGTQVVFQSNNPIHAIQELNDTLLIVEKGTTDYIFHKYVFGQSIQQFAILPQVDFISEFSSIGKSSSHLYFNVKIGANNYDLYRMDFNNPPEFFLDNRGNQITFKDSVFTLISNESLFLKGTLSNPSMVDTIHFEQAIQSPSTRIEESYKNGYHRIRSIEYGYEIVYFQSDSVYQVEASVFGPGSGFPINIDGFYANTGSYYPALNYFIESDSTAYTVLTNRMDADYYMYRLNGVTSQSLFKVDNADEIRQIFTHNGFIYWLEGNNETTSLKRRNLSDPIEQQPSQVAQSDKWFRQFVVGFGNDVYLGSEVQIYPQEIQLDSQGNTVVGFSVNRSMSACKFMSSDTNFSMQFKGSSVYVKYDQFGNFLWANGIGEPNSMFITENKFKVRENGNVVVYGQFFIEAYFDDDSLNAPLAGFYLAELDGNTGVVIWKKKIAEAQYMNYFDTDEIELDEYGNIYIAATYNNFSTSIGGIYVFSEISPATAVAKFDPVGNIIWAKSLKTPWLNFVSRTHVMDYNETFQTLTLVQSQGYYNIWSSCLYDDWGYFIQELDPTGTIINTKEIKGNDIGSMTVGMRTPDNQFFGMGYFRGKLEAGRYTLQTEPLGTCYRTEAFGVIYDGAEGEVIQTSQSNNKAFFPLDGYATSKNMFVLGVSEEKELVVLKYTLRGDYLGYKKLNQKTNPFDWGDRIFLDASDDYILVVGTNFRKDSILNVIPIVNTLPSVSVLKTSNLGWISDDLWMQVAPIVLEDNRDVIIYPNPFNDYIEVLFAGKEMPYDSYQIVDINGRVVQKGELSELQFHTIQLPNLGAGMYLISFFSGNEKLTKQLVKY